MDRNNEQFENDMAHARSIEAGAYAASGDPAYAHSRGAYGRTVVRAKNGTGSWGSFFLVMIIGSPLLFFALGGMNIIRSFIQ